MGPRAYIHIQDISDRLHIYIYRGNVYIYIYTYVYICKMLSFRDLLLRPLAAGFNRGFQQATVDCLAVAMLSNNQGIQSSSFLIRTSKEDKQV